MEKLLLTDNKNSIFEVELIRYFSYDQDYYLIYTLNEKDDKNYLKLYLVEILEELDDLIAQDIKDDAEWKNMQVVIKKVIKEIKSNKRKLLKDESPLMLEKIKINEPRYFKLDEKLANILSSNYSYSGKAELSQEEMNKIEDNISDEDFIIEPIDLPKDEVIVLETEEGNNMNNDIINTENIDNELNDSTEKDLMQNNISENIIEPLNIEETNIELNNNSIVESPVIESNSLEEKSNDESNVESNVDYKALYFAIKEEKEATDVLLDDLLQQLLKYKEKYGELED